MNEKTLILLRHAHRDTDNRGMDNGLSKKGRLQAEMIEKFYVDRFKKLPVPLYSSPKKRCVETLSPLAEKTGVDIQINKLLLEQQASEGMNRVISRAEDFLIFWKNTDDPLIVACSHGDWIPAFVHVTTGQAVDVAKGSWLEFGWSEGRPKLRWMIQSFSAFYE